MSEQPAMPPKGPYAMTVEPGNYAWCACGRTASQPYCDGAHRGTEFRPVVTRIDEHKTVYWCGCRQSKNKPFCDGSHASL